MEDLDERSRGLSASPDQGHEVDPDSLAPLRPPGALATPSSSQRWAHLCFLGFGRTPPGTLSYSQQEGVYPFGLLSP